MSVREQLTTVAEFEAFIAMPENRDRRFELIDGEIVEVSPTEWHGVIATNIATELRNYTKPRKMGRVSTEPYHRNPDDEHNVVMPDVAFTSTERKLPVVEEGAVPQMPDLAVEIKSPNDRYAAMRRKATYYLKNGARLVWLVYPEKRLVEVYRSDEDIEILTENDTLSGGDVLPGLTIPVKTIFEE